MATDSSQRRTQIYEILRRRHTGSTTSELARILGVTTRTINSDIAALRQNGVAIHSSRGRSGGVRLDRAYESGEEFSAGSAAEIFGYAEELGQLNEILDSLEAGQSSITWLAGPPGIGKTTLVRELVASSRVRNIAVQTGWCTEQEGSPPYWPWIQVCRAVLSDFVRRGTGLPESIDWPALSQLDIVPPQRNPQVARRRLSSPFELYSAVAELISIGLANPAGLLILENLHWADQASVELLRYFLDAIGEYRIAVVITTRELDDGKQLLGTDSVRFEHGRIHLNGISDSDAIDLLQLSASTSIAPQMCRQVIAVAEGNPLFIKEFAGVIRDISLAVHDVGESGLADGIHLPRSVQEIVRSRVDKLGNDTREILGAASVIGREFGIDLLHIALPGRSVEELLSLLDQASDSGLVIRVPGRPGRYSFEHSLTRQALRSEIPDTDRLGMHTAIVRHIELQTERGGEHTAELAYHAYEASPLLRTADVISHLHAAGERALEKLAYADALDALTKASNLVENLAPSKQKGDVYFALGRAQVAFEMLAPSVESMVRAFDTYVAAGETAAAVSMATHPYPWGSSTWLTLIERAIELAEPNSLEMGWLLSRRALLITTRLGKSDLGTIDFERALAIANQHNSHLLRVWTYARRVTQQMMLLRPWEALESGRLALSFSSFIDDRHAVGHALYWTGHAALCEGAPEEAERYANAYLELASELRHQFRIVQSADLRGKLSYTLGRWDESLKYMKQLTAGLVPESSGLADYANLALLHFERGESEAGEMALSIGLEGFSKVSRHGDRGLKRSVSISLMLARIASLTRREKYRAMFRAAVVAFPVADLNESLPHRVQILKWTAAAFEAVDRGNQCEAAEYLKKLHPASEDGLNILAGDFMMAMSFHRALGRIAVGAGDINQAIEYFETAMTFLDKAGYTPELAHTAHDYASTLLQRREPRDRYAASKLIERALGICDQIGMIALADLLRDLQQNNEREATITYPDGLSEREIEVLRLAVQGLTNGQISSSLHLAPSTVATHMRNILQKTQTINRTEAVAYAHRVKLA